MTRTPDARYVIPTEDEWYKAAYHKNDGPTDHYWDFPTQTDYFGPDTGPSNELLNPDPGNNANFFENGHSSTGSPYYRTEVGAFSNSVSAYGTYDQGGNVWEWTEAHIDPMSRVLRGGSYGYDGYLAGDTQ